LKEEENMDCFAELGGEGLGLLQFGKQVVRFGGREAVVVGEVLFDLEEDVGHSGLICCK